MAVVTVAFEDLDTWLQNQPANTVDTPYELNITGLTIENLLSSSDTGTLGNVLKNNNSKYVDLSNTSLPSNITYPNGLSGTFMYCKSLVYAPVIPNTVNSLRNTFYQCSSLKTAPNIPIGVYNMDGTFYKCTSLTITPSIPNTVWNMGQTFGSCTALIKVVNIPTSAKDISGVVANCVSLQEISLFEADLETILSEPSSLYKSSSAFYNCPLLTKIGVTETTTVTPEEQTDWHAFRLKFDATTVQGKVYDQTGTAVIIPQTTVTKSTLKLPIKTDELWFPNGYTDAQIDEIIQKVIQYRYTYWNDTDVLDPAEKNFVLWADNPANVKSNLKGMNPVDAVQSGNMNPVTSNAVANSNAMPVNSVTSGNMHSVTSGAVYSALLLLKTVSRGGTLLSGNAQLTGDGLSYTITKKGIVKVNFCKVGQGYSLYLSRNDTVQDRFSFYQGNSNYNFGSLLCFVDVGDTIKIYSDGSYTNFYIQTIILQELGIR